MKEVQEEAGINRRGTVGEESRAYVLGEEGRRRKGRPGLRWEDCVKRELSEG